MTLARWLLDGNFYPFPEMMFAQSLTSPNIICNIYKSIFTHLIVVFKSGVQLKFGVETKFYVHGACRTTLGFILLHGRGI